MNDKETIARHFFLPTFLLCLFLGGAGEGKAQPSYTFSMDQGAYADLAGGTELRHSPGTPLADTVFELDLGGETFTFYDEEYRFDSRTPLGVSGRGFLSFDNARNSVVIDGFLSVLDIHDEGSRISYLIDRSGEETVLKIEWKRLAVIDSPEVAGDYVNFQIWMYQQSRVVELRYGENRVTYVPGQLIGGGPYIGNFQFVQLPVFRILEKNWIVGDVAEPRYDLTKQGFEPAQGCPANGTIYRFTPNNASGVEEEEPTGDYYLYPNPSGEVITLNSSTKITGERLVVRVTDITGRTISRREVSGLMFPLALELPHPGFYICEIIGKDRVERYPLICR